MSVKLLISGKANSGKTTLTKDLKDALVISHDGKSYPFPVPHVTVSSFDSVEELLDLIEEKLDAYVEKFDKAPRTIVFDSVSKILETIYNNCNKKYKNFDVFAQLDAQTNIFTSFIQENLVAQGANVVILSHATQDEKTGEYALVGMGKFQRRGGFLAEVDEALFVAAKGTKRTVYLKTTKMPLCRSLQDLPETMEVADFNLQNHIEMLEEVHSTNESFEL